MKTKILFVIFCIFTVSLFCDSIFAATELWSYNGWEKILQIVPDSKGGCAFVRVETNDIAEVVWLDKKGELVYKTNINMTNSFGPPPINILFFKKKSLFIFDVRNDVKVVIEIDNKGQETITQSPGNDVSGPLFMLYTPSQLSDKRGFFAVKIDVIAGRQYIVRFNNK